MNKPALTKVAQLVKPQENAQPQVPEEAQALIDILANQRSASENALAIAQAKLAVTERQVQRLAHELAKANAEIARLTPQSAEPATAPPSDPPASD